MNLGMSLLSPETYFVFLSSPTFRLCLHTEGAEKPGALPWAAKVLCGPIDRYKKFCLVKLSRVVQLVLACLKTIGVKSFMNSEDNRTDGFLSLLNCG